MTSTPEMPDPSITPLAALDDNDSRLFQQDAWRPYFERLRSNCIRGMLGLPVQVHRH